MNPLKILETLFAAADRGNGMTASMHGTHAVITMSNGSFVPMIREGYPIVSWVQVLIHFLPRD